MKDFVLISLILKSKTKQNKNRLFYYIEISK